MFTQLSLIINAKLIILLVMCLIVALTTKSLYYICTTPDDADTDVSSEDSLVFDSRDLQSFIAYRVLCITACLLVLLSFESTALLGHVFFSGATTAWITITSVLFLITLKFFYFKKTVQGVYTPYAVLVCYIILVLCWTLWTVNSALSLILIIDSLNIALYILFFTSVSDSSNLVSSISTFFWTAFLSTLLFFIFMIVFYMEYATLNTAVSAQILNIVLFSTSSRFLKAFSFTLLICFICIKLGLAPFFHWKVLLLKALSVKAACFYVIFYFSVVFMFFARALLCGNILFITTTGSAYFILILAVVTLFAFNTPNATIAKFLTYSSAINGSLVITLCAAACFVL